MSTSYSPDRLSPLWCAFGRKRDVGEARFQQVLRSQSPNDIAWNRLRFRGQHAGSARDASGSARHAGKAEDGLEAIEEESQAQALREASGNGHTRVRERARDYAEAEGAEEAVTAITVTGPNLRMAAR